MKAFYETRKYDKFLPLQVISCKGFDFLAHWHNDIEIIYITEGQLKVGINNETQLLEKGDLAVCSSGNVHYYASLGLDSQIFMMIFKPELVDSKTKWPFEQYFKSPFFRYELQKLYGLDKKIEEIFRNTYNNLNSSSKYSSYFIKSSVYELCGLLLENLPSLPLDNLSGIKGYSMIKSVQTVLQFLEENYMKEIPLKDAARIGNMSTFYFSRIFKQVTGRNYLEYLNRIRINKAEEMIITKQNSSILEIALDCGFGSIRTFNRAFKAINGYVPSKQREKDLTFLT